MELRYCELCGEIIKLQGGEESIGGGTHVCERCSSKQQASPLPVKKKAEEIAFRRETAGQEGGTVAKEITLDKLLADNELDLYSADTLARRKVAQAPKEQEKTRTATKIKLLDPDAPVAQRAAPQTTAGSGSAAVATLTAPPTQADYLAEQPQQQKDTGSKTVKLKAIPPAPPERVKFPCALCGVTLEVGPLTKTSRLHCPRCRAAMTISPDRQVRLLEGGSVAVRLSGPSAAPQEGPQDFLNLGGTFGNAPLPPVETPARPPAPKTTVIRNPPTPVRQPATSAPTETIEDLTQHIMPRQPRTAEVQPQRAPQYEEEEREQLVFEQRQTIRTLTRALVMGLVLAAPFYAWSVLLLIGQHKTVGVWLETYGGIVKEVFDKLLK